MKERLAFLLAIHFALVLLVAAAVPSYATQHRDPVIPAESQPSAQPDGSSPASVPKTKGHASPKKRLVNPNGAAKKNAATSANEAGDATGHSSSTSAK